MESLHVAGVKCEKCVYQPLFVCVPKRLQDWVHQLEKSNNVVTAHKTTNRAREAIKLTVRAHETDIAERQ